MLSTSLVQQLEYYGIHANSIKDFLSGNKLVQLITKVFYDGENIQLSNKMRADQGKTGIMITNINTILNYLKKDISIIMNQQIKKLTAFKIIEEQDAMRKLIQWILNYNKNNYQMSPPRQQDIDFKNLYFVSNMQKGQTNICNSQNKQQEEKIVRKGSYKLLRPKMSSQSKSIKYSQNDSLDENNQNKHVTSIKSQKIPLQERNINQIENNSKNQEDLVIRKTLPKMFEKPPIYRPKRHSNLEGVNTSGESTSRIINKTQRNHELMKQVNEITDMISEQQKSLLEINKVKQTNKTSQTKKNKFVKLNQQQKGSQIKQKINKKIIMKLDLPQINQSKQKSLVEWIVCINLIKVSTAKYLHQLHHICKDGVLFIQILNYYRGRGKQLSYFKQPKKSAQLHSNYQKLFTTLAQIPQFSSNLLYHFQYFIPQVQHAAFWNMLQSLNISFDKRIKKLSDNVYRYQNQQSKKLQKSFSKNKSLIQSISYQQLKYNGQFTPKQRHNKGTASTTHFSTKQQDKKISKFSQKSNKSKSIESEKQKNKIAPPPYGLIQIQQPPSQELYNTRGYKDLYLSKYKNIQSPAKSKKSMNSSLSRSRIRGSLNSSLKKQYKPNMPSISLQMQMKVLKYLKNFVFQQNQPQLFKDPYRNGTLLCMIVKRQLNIQCFINKKPNNIEDCRSNFISAMNIIKQKRSEFNHDYQYFVQDLVKGQKRLFYGLVWYLIKPQAQTITKITNNITYNEPMQDAKSIDWIRTVQKLCPTVGQYRIRSQVALYHAMVNTNFLYTYAQFITNKKSITPTYNTTLNNIHKQVNLKKVVGYLVHNKIIRSDHLIKVKSIVKLQQHSLAQLVDELVRHFFKLQRKQIKISNYLNNIQHQPIEQNHFQQKEKRLQTTMANQTFSQNICIKQQQSLDIPWMRKLGFTGSLQLNNGVILCRLISKLTMHTIPSVNQQPQTRAQCLCNIRKALKQLHQFKWSQLQVYESTLSDSIQIYGWIRQKFKNSYALKGV